MNDDWKEPLRVLLWLLVAVVALYIVADVLMFLIGLAILGTKM